MKRKILATTLLLCLLAGLTVGCSSKATPTQAPSVTNAAVDPTKAADPVTPEEKPITIEYFSQKSEEAAQEAYRIAAEDFHAEYPNITVQIVTVPDSEKVLTARMAANDAPTTFHDKPTSAAFFERASEGYYVDLTNQPFINNAISSVVDAVRAESGAVYALPYSQNFMGVFYNVDIFEENNLDIPLTWQELLDTAQKLQDKGILPFTQTSLSIGHLRGGLIAALYPEGLPYLAECTQDANKKPSASADYRTFATEAYKLLQYCNDDFFGIPQTQAMENFANGKSAMMIYGSYGKGTFVLLNPDLRLGVFPIPGLTETSGLVYAGVDASLCVSAKASPEQQAAGLKWIEFLSRPENAQKWSNLEGAPSAINGTTYGGDGTPLLLDTIKEGRVREWKAYYNSTFSDVQAFEQLFIDGNVDAFLENVDEVWANAINSN